eukprot:gene6972-14167_t
MASDTPLKGRSIEFLCNIDMTEHGWTRHLDVFNEVIPDWMRCCSSMDALRHLRQKVLGVNLPQIYFKVPGVWTGGHEENDKYKKIFHSVNCNVGPGSSEWFGIEAQYVPKLRILIRKTFGIDILRQEGCWYPDPTWLTELKIPFSYGIQHAGDVVFVKGSTLHWVRSLGFSSHFSWNFGRLELEQIHTSMIRYYDNMLWELRRARKEGVLIKDYYPRCTYGFFPPEACSSIASTSMSTSISGLSTSTSKRKSIIKNSSTSTSASDATNNTNNRTDYKNKRNKLNKTAGKNNTNNTTSRRKYHLSSSSSSSLAATITTTASTTHTPTPSHTPSIQKPMSSRQQSLLLVNINRKRKLDELHTSSTTTSTSTKTSNTTSTHLYSDNNKHMSKAPRRVYGVSNRVNNVEVEVEVDSDSETCGDFLLRHGRYRKNSYY